MRTRRPWRPLAVATLATAVAAVALVPTTDGPAVAPVAAQEPRPYTLEVTPSTGLVDGQAVDVRVTAAAGRRIGVGGTLRICRADATYERNDDVLPFVGGNCPNVPVSSSASGPWPIRPFPDGSAAISTVRVGTGTVKWGPGTDPEQFSLTCDPANPCRLVIDVVIEGGQRYYDASTLLTFADDDAFAACGGIEASALASGGPDRLLASWVRWTRELCQAGGIKAATQAVLTGESDGHRAFASGFADLTYSAVGASYPGDEPSQRASVSVPLGLNAVVVGILGGYGSTAPDWPSAVPHPYEEVKLTMAEMATLFGKGPFSFGIDHDAAVRQRNPELASGLSLNNSDTPNPQMLAPGDGGTWLVTTAFDELAGEQWRTSPIPVTGNPPDAERDVVTSFAEADPPFVSAFFDLYSAQTQMKKLVAANEFKPYNYGPIWILTDLATATQLGIPTVAVQNAAGAFVQPTPASLAAAVPGMEVLDDGTHLPDPSNPAAAAYPLTFVEHAVVPHEPLLDEDCEPRSAAQDLLDTWLTYVTGAGQSTLAPGLQPLTPALATAATASIAEVGTATPTGDCAPDPTTTTTTTSTTTTTTPPSTTSTTTPSPELPPALPPELPPDLSGDLGGGGLPPGQIPGELSGGFPPSSFDGTGTLGDLSGALGPPSGSSGGSPSSGGGSASGSSGGSTGGGSSGLGTSGTAGGVVATDEGVEEVAAVAGSTDGSDDDADDEDEVATPALASASSPSSFRSATGLVALAVLGALGGWLSTGRSFRPGRGRP